MSTKTVNARISPDNYLHLLSREETNAILQAVNGPLSPLFHSCSLAVLNHDNCQADNDQALLERYPDYAIRVFQEEGGIKLELRGAPACAFVDGEMIRGINDHLFALLRDIMYLDPESRARQHLHFDSPAGITDAVFQILRNARAFKPEETANTVVCWGGHAISRDEYEYSKEVGYQLGLHDLDICTGCGNGAMKGPMKGAAIGHAQQHYRRAQYLGISEPGIIAAESPNPIVDDLVVMPDIEKRLEAFVRVAHAIIVFPGGVGTMEEILYILGILLDPANARHPLPLVLTGPESARGHFALIDKFLQTTLGPEIREQYRVIIDDPEQAGSCVAQGIKQVRAFRKASKNANCFNWSLHIPPGLQEHFQPTHENMRALRLVKDQPANELACTLRRAFSGIVAGNVKANGIKTITEYGPFVLQGEAAVIEPMDEILTAFIKSQRMRLHGQTYAPSYRLEKI